MIRDNNTANTIEIVPFLFRKNEQIGRLLEMISSASPGSAKWHTKYEEKVGRKGQMLL